MLGLYIEAIRAPMLVRQPDLQGQLSRIDHQNLWLFQSDLNMNISGNAIAKAFRIFQKEHPEGIMCVLHDEMEMKLGTAKLRWRGQARGHNGIRSCIERLGTSDFARIGIGIDRPESRNSLAVTAHVLGKFKRDEMALLREKTLSALITAMEKLRAGEQAKI
jgi:PTH1 family peptidyl-tRNA hydrolase